MSRPTAPHPGQRPQRLATWALGLAVLLLGACRAGQQDREPPSIIFISLDTWRWDALGILRHDGSSLTPNIDRLAADSVLLSQAVVPMPFTLPSHMSMFTGLYPQVHRVATAQNSLSTSIQTLPEILAQAGYRTVGRVTNDWLKAEFGFGRGFEDYQRLPHRLTYSERVNASAAEALASAAGDARPLFLFLHYMDAHSDFFQQGRNRLPYYAPERFRDPGEAVDPAAFCDEQGRCATQFLLEADREGRILPREDLATLRRLYESGIRYLDHDLGALFDLLRQHRLYDDSIIVLTSDHGEEFQEHGKLLHSQIYDESVRVVVLLKLPDQRLAGTQIDSQVEIIDLQPTLLDLAGLRSPEKIQGRSLVPLIRGEALTERGALSQNKLNRMRYSLRTESHKIIRDLETGSEEVYDLQRDPGETSNLAESDPELTRRLRQRLEAAVSTNRRLAKELDLEVAPQGITTESLLSEEEQERLRALGYIQ